MSAVLIFHVKEGAELQLDVSGRFALLMQDDADLGEPWLIIDQRRKPAAPARFAHAT